MKKKKQMIGNYPQRCYIVKAAKELQLKNSRFSYAELYSATKKYSPEIKIQSLYAIGAMLFRTGILLRSMAKDPKKNNLYFLSEKGLGISWKETPTGYVSGSRKVTPRKAKEVVKKLTQKILKDKEVKGKGLTIERILFVEDVLLYINHHKSKAKDFEEKYNDRKEKHRKDVKDYRQIIAGKNKELEELRTALELLKNRHREATGKTSLMEDVARFKTGQA